MQHTCAFARHDSVSERLRRWTRNPLGSARKGFESPRCRLAALLALMLCFRHILTTQRLYSSVAEHQFCKLKVQGSIPCAGSAMHRPLHCFEKHALREEGVQKELWRNGSASDSRSEGWEFGSLWPHMAATGTLVFLSLTHNPLPETLKGKERSAHIYHSVFFMPHQSFAFY